MTGQPPRPDQRIASLDILRGFALLGMIIVHFHDHSTEPGGVDDLLRTLTWRLVETKSHGTFALLFGAGLALQFYRGEKEGRNARLSRRLGVLALFGFCAQEFFGFNVLLGYAVWGFPLLLILNLDWKARGLIITAVISAVSVALFHLTLQTYLRFHGGEPAIEAFYGARVAVMQSVVGGLDAALAQSSYLVLLAARLRHLIWFNLQPWSVMPANTLCLFAIGTIFMQRGYFEDPKGHAKALSWMGLFGVVSWALSLWVLAPLGFNGLFGLLRDQWLTFGYVCGALLIIGYWPAIVPRLSVFANAGRMAFTNYMVQIAALDLLFSGYAIGLGKVRPVLGLVMALTLFTVEAAWSTWWLRRYKYGPFEWIWRSATNWQWEKIRRSTPGLAAQPAS